MCGIGGLFGGSFSGADRLQLAGQMADLIAHRGPDDAGFHLLQEGVLLHRRLSIVDLSSAGHQPMATPDGQTWIVFNGEIYNFIEIRQELVRLGHTFATHTDTEVILLAYREWGVAALHRFNGMFSFLLVDLLIGKVFAVRDRFGVKPLYYWQLPCGALAFASEIKQFTRLPGWRAVANGQRLYDYLSWSVIDHTRETLFSGVFQLRGGEMAQFDLGAREPQLQIERWYHLRQERFAGSFEEAAYQFRALCVDAVRLRLRADVEVGSCLSGGLDSSTIVSLASGLLKEQSAAKGQRTFTSCSDNPLFDERRYVEEVVAATRVQAHYVYPSPSDYFETARKILWHQDEPYHSASLYAQWSVFEAARRHGVKVMLDGQGADEQLAGYQAYFGARYTNLLLRGRWLLLLKELGGASSSSRAFGLLLNEVLPQWLRQPLRRLAGKGSSRPSWLRLDRLGAVPADPARPPAGRCRVQALSEHQLLQSHLPMLLHWEDRNSMAHSIEARVPFLDYRLVEFVTSLPSEFKISGGWTKRVLRSGMEGMLPRSIGGRRDKQAFGLPEGEWFQGALQEPLRRGLRQAVERAQGAIHPSICQIGEEMIAGRRPFHESVWRVVMCGEWIDQFGVEVPSST